jgi:hypothetical protein
VNNRLALAMLDHQNVSKPNRRGSESFAAVRLSVQRGSARHVEDGVGKLERCLRSNGKMGDADLPDRPVNDVATPGFAWHPEMHKQVVNTCDSLHTVVVGDGDNGALACVGSVEETIGVAGESLVSVSDARETTNITHRFPRLNLFPHYEYLPFCRGRTHFAGGDGIEEKVGFRRNLFYRANFNLQGLIRSQIGIVICCIGLQVHGRLPQLVGG